MTGTGIVSQVIDRKFRIYAINPCKGNIYTEEDGVFFCAKDAAFPAALDAYRTECVKLGCGDEHIYSIDLLIERVKEYQTTHRKLPDTETDCEMKRCIGGEGL
jgi:hypothetical protein